MQLLFKNILFFIDFFFIYSICIKTLTLIRLMFIKLEISYENTCLISENMSFKPKKSST